MSGGESGGPPPEGLPQQLIVTSNAAAEAVLASKADVSNRLFDGLELKGAIVRQSLLPGVVFRDCTLLDVDFSRSDFEGARFERCTFQNTNWDHADIRSCIFAQCSIRTSTFRDAYVSDCAFIDSMIADVAFDRSTLLRNRFERSTLQRITNPTCTILHTDFVRTTLDGVRLGDCTALYSIFEECQLSSFFINGDAIGLSYGLSVKQLSEAGLIFLGDEDAAPVGLPLPSAFVQTFRDRGWPLHAIIAGMALGSIQRLDGLRLVFELLGTQAQASRRLSADDADFVVRLLSLLERRQELPFAAVIYGADRLSPLAHVNEDEMQRRVIAMLISHLTLLLARMEDVLRAAAAPLAFGNPDSRVVAEFVFDSQPPSDPGSALLFLAQGRGASAVLLAPRIGSWIQPLETTTKGLLAILASLYLLEGCVIKLTEIRARTDILIAQELPATYLDRARDPRQQMPEEIRTAIEDAYNRYLRKDITPPSPATGLHAGSLRHVAVSSQDDSASSQ